METLITVLDDTGLAWRLPWGCRQSVTLGVWLTRLEQRVTRRDGTRVKGGRP